MAGQRVRSASGRYARPSRSSTEMAIASTAEMVVSDPQPLVERTAGPDEEHPVRPVQRQQARRLDRRRDRTDAGGGHDPPGRRRGVEPGQLGREGGEEKGRHPAILTQDEAAGQSNVVPGAALPWPQRLR